MNKKITLFLDNEGPCTIGDNAFEATRALAEKCGLGAEVGTRFFRNLSNIDDIWGDFPQHRPSVDPEYSAGHTLKVILPFYLAMGATRQWLYDFAASTLQGVPDIAEAMQYLTRRFDVWQISTSYDFYVRAFCDLVGLDFERARCTQVPAFDDFCLTKPERDQLLRFIQLVAEHEPVVYNRVTGDIDPGHQFNYDAVTKFVWKTLYYTAVGEHFLTEVGPIGQRQKRFAVTAILQQRNVPVTDAMYVGDSQTDVEAMRGLFGYGLTMAFNGKGRIFDYTDIMYAGPSAMAIAEVASMFSRVGRSETRDVYSIAMSKMDSDPTPVVLATVTQDNRVELERRSLCHRKALRGVHIGQLT